MNIRKWLRSCGRRFSNALFSLVSEDSATLFSIKSSVSRLSDQIQAMQEELSSQMHSVGIHAIAFDARANAIDEQLKRLSSGLQQQEADRLKEIGDLRGFAWKIYSQNGEDGILKEIFRRIGTTNQAFVEFGVESGVQCNTRYLAEMLGWSGVYFEPNDENFQKLQVMWHLNAKIQTFHDAITSENFEEKLEAANVPNQLDLLVIDIDSNDYWVWKSLVRWRPRVIVVEYNPFHLPPKKWVMKEDPSYRWNQTTYFGASFTSFYLLGKSKGYCLVGTDPMGVNMFFVRDDCMNDQFLDPALHYFFQPFGYSRPPTFDGPHEEV